MARRQLGTRRVGHAGTLDPLASGVLVLLTEEHTRLSNFLTASHKSYLAWVSFGASTPTLDAEGPLQGPADPPELSQLRATLPTLFPAFLELSEQVPPNYSAVKQAGVKGYEAARRGELRDMPARAAGYSRIELLDVAESLSGLPRGFVPVADGMWHAGPDGRGFELPAQLAELPTALISVQVQAGTYIRSFARDLGEQLGSGAFLSGLVRTAAGRIPLEQAVPPTEISEAKGLDPLDVLPFPTVQLDEAQAARVRQGQRLRPEFADLAVLVDPAGSIVAIAQNEDGRMKLRAVFN